MGILEESKKVADVKASNASETMTVREAFIILPMVTFFIGCLAVLAYQVYHWLYSGFWKSLSATIVLQKVLPDSFFVWLQDESSWVGAKKIVTGITTLPLAIFLFICGGIWIFLACIVDESIDKKKQQANTEKKQSTI